ncbi:MAG: hypothetical protein LBS01_10790 [Prevotellaceae bacterium]|jgi:hypothetical protein|nr:hypothetical protein [Prevotellaceae bacterium]
MKTSQPPTTISDGTNRRFFKAIDALIERDKIYSLQSFCDECNLHAPRYREMRLTYGRTPNPLVNSRYKTIEIEALHKLVDKYNISAYWLITGKGNIFTQS